MESSSNYAPRPRFFHRWYFRATVAGVVLLAALVWAWLAYRAGKLNQYVARQVEAAALDYGVRAEVGGFELGRGIRSATLRDVKFYNQTTGQLLGTLGRGVVDLRITDLFALNLRRNVVFQRLELENLDVNVEIDEQGRSNLDGLHPAPPRAPSRITFDLNSLVGGIKNGRVRFDDRQRDLLIEAPNVQATFQPAGAAGLAEITAQLTARNNRIVYEGRAVAVNQLSFDGKLAENSAQIKQLTANSPLGDLKASGKVENWSAPRYELDAQLNAELAEIARLVSPATDLTGAASFIGKVSGEQANYQINGDLKAPTLNVEGVRVREVRLDQFTLKPQGDTLQISAQRAAAQSVQSRDFQATALAAPNVSLTIKTGAIKTADVSATISTAQASIAQLRLTTAPVRLEALTLRNLQAEVSGAAINAQSNVSLRRATYEKLQASDTTGKLTLTQNTAAFSNFTSKLLGGAVKGSATVNTARGASRLEATFADVQTAQLVNAFAVKDVPLAGAINGDVNVTFPGTQAELLSGTFNARFTGQTQNLSAGDIPVNGTVAAQIQRGVVNLNPLQLSTNATTLTANGALTQRGESNLSFTLDTTRAEELLTIANSLAALQPTIREYQPNAAGALNFTGMLQGQLTDPTLRGALTAAQVGVKGELLGSLRGQLTFAPAEIRFEDALLTANSGGTVNLSYAAPRAETATSGTLNATFTRLKVADVVKVGGVNVEAKWVDGELTGTARLTGLPAAPQGRVEAKLENGGVLGQPAQLATAQIVFDAQTARLERTEIRLPQGRLIASGSYDLKTKNFQAQGQAEQVNLGGVADAFEFTGATITGNADATFTATGNADDLNQLNVQLTATGSQLTINSRAAGELKINARTAANGRIDAELVTNITGQPQAFTASVELRQPGRPIQVATDLNDLDLTPLLAIFAPGAVDTVTGKVTGALRVTGPLVDAQDQFSADRLRGSLTLNAVALNVSGTAINLATPVVLALDNAQLRLQPTRVTATGTDLSLGGTIGLREGQSLDFALNGRVNLADFRINPDTFAEGTVVIDARLGGTASAPALAGDATLRDIAFTALDAPVNLSNGNGRVVFAGQRITLESFTAQANDGAVTASGGITLEGLQPKDWRFTATAREVDIFYAGARALANADLTLNGTPDSQTLGGTITLPLVEYTQDFSFDDSFGGGGNLSFGGFSGGNLTSANAGGGAFPPVNLNLRVEARDAIVLRNQQVNTVASAVLTIGGTLSEPEPAGRISFEGGTITLRKTRYEITAGTLDLAAADQPYLNLLAEGTVSGYQVGLGLTGPIDSLEINLTSTPQLPRAEILSLVTTGRTESTALTGNDLVYSGASTAASLLTQEFISKPIQGETQKLLGLNLFQIDPVLRPNANPAARLTIGRQIAQGLSFTFSTNLAAEQDQTAILEYNVTSRFSALASFTQGGSSRQQGSNDNDFTIEIRGRKRFALGSDKDVLNAAAAPRPTLTRPNITPRQLPKALVDVNKPDAVKLSEKELPRLLPVLREGYSRALTRLGERNLTNYLQEQGYFFAEVTARCEPANCAGPDLRVWYDVQPGARYELADIRLTGTEQLALGDVQGELQSQESSLFGSVPYLKNLPLIGGLARGITSDTRLRNDAETIRRRMIDLGFRSARISARRAVTPEDDNLVIVFDVTEGPRSLVAEVQTTGNSVLSMQELLKLTPQKQGAAFSPSDIRAGATAVRQAYAQRGYLEAKANIRVNDLPNDRVQVTYEISEGAQSVAQQISVQGLGISREASVRRFFDFKPGDVLTRQSIRRTQRDLYATGAFSEVDIRPQPLTSNADGARDVIVKLTEAKPLLLVYGLGYSTDEGPRALAQLTHTNLLGRVNSASLRLRGSRREQLAQLQYTDLRPFGTRWATTASVFYNRNADLQAFARKTVDQQNQNTRGTTFGINRFASYIQTERKYTDNTAFRFRYNYETAKLFNLQNIPDLEATRNERALRLGIVSAGVSRDTRDSIVNPTRGLLLSADHSLAASFFGGNESFNKFFGNAQWYRRLPNGVPLLRNSILAVSSRIGLAASFKITDRDSDGVLTEPEQRLPISERFFSGGATTLRGFQFEQAGPQGILEPRNANELPTLVPLGGDALALFNFELRYPLTRRVSVVPFYDLGNVFRKTRDFSFRRMTNTVGFGIRFNTPVGPIGVDYGYLLDPPSFVTASGAVLRQRQGVLHIRFGQSF